MNLSSKNLIRSSPNIRKPFQLLLAAFLILSVYYPAFLAGWCRVDDIDIMNQVRHIGPWDIKRIVVPGFQEGAYYRPITMISFLFDKYLWNFDLFWMHAENILLHTINALLVYWLAYQLSNLAHRRNNWAPFLAALFFGIHPVNTESVNWISGRSDVLAAFFILLSANALLLARKTGSFRWMLVAGSALLLGILTKEVALPFLFGTFLLLSAPVRALDSVISFSNKKNGDKTGRQLRLLLFTAAAALAAFFVLRSFAFHTTEFRVGKALGHIAGDPPVALLTFLQALGFYAKKLFIPVPLNFAIMEVDPLYRFLAVPLVALVLMLLRLRPLHGALCVIGFLLLSPSFIIATGKITWAPYAERYLYVASAFFVTAVVDIFIQTWNNLSTKAVAVSFRSFAAVVILVFAAASLQRSSVWMTNEKLFEDTISKSPQVASLRIDYALMLVDLGKTEEARRQMEIVREISQSRMEAVLSQIYAKSIESTADIRFAEAYILDREGKYHDAVMHYDRLITPRTKWSDAALERASSLTISMLARNDDAITTAELKIKIEKYARMLYNKHTEPEMLYLMAKTFLNLGETETAKHYLTMVRNGFKQKDMYSQFSIKLIQKLEQKL